MRINDWSSDVCSFRSPFDESFRKSDYEWGELLLFAKRNAIAELQEFDWRTKLSKYTERDSTMLTRLPYQTFSDEYDRGRLSLFVDRGLATQAYRLSGSAWTSILPLTFFVGRSEEHTSELPSLLRNSDAVFFLKTKN